MNEGRSLHPSKNRHVYNGKKIAYANHYEYGSSIIGQGFVMGMVEDPPPHS